MKTIKQMALKAALVCIASVAAVLPGKAQLFQNSYMNIDWQYNVPLGDSFASKSSGWGMNFEGGYFVTPNISVGAFIAYHTNLESIDRQTLILDPSSSMTTSQKHTMFQLPFGVSGRYNFMTESVLQPYVGMKLGASYAQFSSYYYIIKQYENTWGFYMSPEIGVNIFPYPSQRIGFHVALYYSYATNSADLLTYSVNNINNFGLRLGISF